MLIVFQVPLADLRAFRSLKLRRESPHWPTPDSGREFIRYFGQVRDRDTVKRPVVSADEKYYANASSALKFPPFTGGRESWSIAFRRVLSDGDAVTRVEVGFGVPREMARGRPVLELIGLVLDTPCMVRGIKDPRRLVHTGTPLCNLYQRATSMRPPGAEEPKDEVTGGRPTVLVQYDSSEIGEMPKTLNFQANDLAYLKTTHAGVDLNIWFAGPGFGDARSARLALLRMSAEHQCLKYVLRDLASGKAETTRGSAESERLQRYLNAAETTFSQASRFGVNQQSLVQLSQTYEDLCGADELPLLREQMKTLRPQIATRMMALAEASNQSQPAAGAQDGPEFKWRGSIDELEYQSFFTPNRPPVDVQWVDEVIRNLCPAVCLIEIARIGRRATGFLVGKDLLLTNYHVIEFFAGDDLERNLAEMEVRFTRSSAPHRVFKLAAKGLVKGSPIPQLDYALLRLEEAAAEILPVRPFVCDGLYQPIEKQGLSIIQHPGGGPLKLATDENGVTGVYVKDGRVQYISSAQVGSSGSPCVDGDQRLVALHHAELSRPLGSVREGILMSTIHQEIGPYLN